MGRHGMGKVEAVLGLLARGPAALRAPGRLVGTAAAALLVAGCVTVRVGADGDVPQTRYHQAVPAGPIQVDRPLHTGLVTVANLSSPARYDLRIVEDLGGGSVQFLEYDRWAEAPADAVSDVIRETLARSEVFGGVAEPGGDLAVAAIDGHLLGCDTRRTDSGTTLELRLTLRLTAVPSGRLLDFGYYQAEVEVGAADGQRDGQDGAAEVPAYGPAVAEAVRKILTEALGRWVPVLADQ